MMSMKTQYFHISSIIRMLYQSVNNVDINEQISVANITMNDYKVMIFGTLKNRPKCTC